MMLMMIAELQLGTSLRRCHYMGTTVCEIQPNLDRESCVFSSFLLSKGSNYWQTFSPPRFSDPRAALEDECSVC